MCHSSFSSGISPKVIISFLGSRGPQGRSSLLSLAKQVFELLLSSTYYSVYRTPKICSYRGLSGCYKKLFPPPSSPGTPHTPSTEHSSLSDSLTHTSFKWLEAPLEQGPCSKLGISADRSSIHPSDSLRLSNSKSPQFTRLGS